MTLKSCVSHCTVTGTLDAQGFSYITLPASYENKAVNIKLILHRDYGWNDFLHDASAVLRIGAGVIMLVGAVKDEFSMFCEINHQKLSFSSLDLLAIPR